MKFSKVEEELLRLTMNLAASGGQMTLNELAESEGMTLALVAKILGKLRRGGIVRAVRGRHGGYELSRPKEQLSIAAILSTLDKPLLEGCFNHLPKIEGTLCCPHDGSCGLRPLLRRVEAEITGVLGQITLADLICSEIHMEILTNELFPTRRRKTSH